MYRQWAKPIDVCASIALDVEREEQQFRDTLRNGCLQALKLRSV
jgi:hypothetical protein